METLVLIIEVIIGTLIGNVIARLCIKQPEEEHRLKDNKQTRMYADMVFKTIPEDAKEELKSFVNEDSAIQDAILLRAGTSPKDLDTMKKILKDQVNKMK